MNDTPRIEPQRQCLVCGYPFRSMQEAKRYTYTDAITDIVTWQCRDVRACNARALLRAPHQTTPHRESETRP